MLLFCSAQPHRPICACCQVRVCTNTGANATRIVAKRAGTCNMAASPARDPPGYAYPLRHPIAARLQPPINGQSRTKVSNASTISRRRSFVDA